MPTLPTHLLHLRAALIAGTLHETPAHTNASNEVDGSLDCVRNYADVGRRTGQRLGWRI